MANKNKSTVKPWMVKAAAYTLGAASLFSACKKDDPKTPAEEECDKPKYRAAFNVSPTQMPSVKSVKDTMAYCRVDGVDLKLTDWHAAAADMVATKLPKMKEIKDVQGTEWVDKTFAPASIFVADSAFAHDKLGLDVRAGQVIRDCEPQDNFYSFGIEGFPANFASDVTADKDDICVRNSIVQSKNNFGSADEHKMAELATKVKESQGYSYKLKFEGNVHAARMFPADSAIYANAGFAASADEMVRPCTPHDNFYSFSISGLPAGFATSISNDKNDECVTNSVVKSANDFQEADEHKMAELTAGIAQHEGTSPKLKFTGIVYSARMTEADSIKLRDMGFESGAKTVIYPIVVRDTSIMFNCRGGPDFGKPQVDEWHADPSIRYIYFEPYNMEGLSSGGMVGVSTMLDIFHGWTPKIKAGNNPFDDVTVLSSTYEHLKNDLKYKFTENIRIVPGR